MRYIYTLIQHQKNDLIMPLLEWNIKGKFEWEIIN